MRNLTSVTEKGLMDRGLKEQDRSCCENYNFHSGLLNYFFVLERRFINKTHAKLITHRCSHWLGCVNEQEVYTSKAPSPVLLHTPNLQQQLIFHKCIVLLPLFHNNLSSKQRLHACLCSGFNKASVTVTNMQKKKKKCRLSPSFDTLCNLP